MEIEVTQKDIEDGMKDIRGDQCILGLAFRRAFKIDDVEMGFNNTWINGKRIKIPQATQEQISLATRGETIKPFKFDIEEA